LNLRTIGMTFAAFMSMAAAANARADSRIWLEDALPAGAKPEGEAWNFVSSNPSPLSGAKAHQSPIASGMHQHYFTGSTDIMKVPAGST